MLEERLPEILKRGSTATDAVYGKSMPTVNLDRSALLSVPNISLAGALQSRLLLVQQTTSAIWQSDSDLLLAIIKRFQYLT